MTSSSLVSASEDKFPENITCDTTTTREASNAEYTDEVPGTNPPSYTASMRVNVQGAIGGFGKFRFTTALKDPFCDDFTKSGDDEIRVNRVRVIKTRRVGSTRVVIPFDWLYHPVRRDPTRLSPGVNSQEDNLASLTFQLQCKIFESFRILNVDPLAWMMTCKLAYARVSSIPFWTNDFYLNEKINESGGYQLQTLYDGTPALEWLSRNLVVTELFRVLRIFSYIDRNVLCTIQSGLMVAMPACTNLTLLTVKVNTLRLICLVCSLLLHRLRDLHIKLNVKSKKMLFRESMSSQLLTSSLLKLSRSGCNRLKYFMRTVTGISWVKSVQNVHHHLTLQKLSDSKVRAKRLVSRDTVDIQNMEETLGLLFRSLIDTSSESLLFIKCFNYDMAFMYNDSGQTVPRLPRLRVFCFDDTSFLLAKLWLPSFTTRVCRNVYICHNMNLYFKPQVLSPMFLCFTDRRRVMLSMEFHKDGEYDDITNFETWDVNDTNDLKIKRTRHVEDQYGLDQL